MTSAPTPPSRIEIAGVAGAGKSTLTRALGDATGWPVADFLHTKLPAHWPYVAHGAPGVLHLLSRCARDATALSWDELKLLIYVSEWHRFLRARHPSAPTILDQGPLFALAALLWEGKPVTRSGAFKLWLEERIATWSLELRAIVRLVAPEDVLLARINGRRQDHEAKGRTAQDGLRILAAHQRAYEELFDRVAGLGRPPVLCFDTSAMSAAEVAGEVVAILGSDS